MPHSGMWCRVCASQNKIITWDDRPLNVSSLFLGAPFFIGLSLFLKSSSKIAGSCRTERYVT